MRKLLSFLLLASCSYGQSLFAPQTFSFMGDSRTSLMNVTGGVYVGGQLLGKAAWWPYVAADLTNQSIRIIQNYGIGGFRSDQWTTYGGLAEGVLTDAAQTVVMGPGCVNDIASVPYTTISGQAVTISNVASVCASNIINAANRVIQANKNVIILSETGENGWTGNNIAAVLEVNLRLRSYCLQTAHALYFDVTPIMWQPNQSTTLTFTAGYSTDGIHPNVLGSYNIGVLFSQLLTPNLTPYSFQPVSQFQNVSISPLCLMSSTYTLFNTLTGGSTGGITLTSGTVPAGITVSGGGVGSSVIVTSAADASGYGNDVTFAFTTTQTDTIYILWYIYNGYASVGDKVVFSANVSVASGQSNFSIPYLQLQDTGTGCSPGNTTQTVAYYDLIPLTITNGPTTTYSLQESTSPAPVVPGNCSAVNAINPSVVLQATGAGHITVTLSRPDVHKVF
jgi:hypothetical protein